MRSRVISWLAVAGAISALSACGASSPTHSRSTPVATLAESAALRAFIARGDQICRKGNEAIAPVNARGAAIEARHSGTRREAQLMVRVLREGLRHFRRFYEQLTRIPPPPGERATVEKILAGLRRVGDDGEHLTSALKRGDGAAIRAITAEREMDHARVSALELEFGFKVCGQPASRSPVSG